MDTPIDNLQIIVRPSAETNDHEVCLLKDGENLIDQLGSGFIGLDPDEILKEPSRLLATAKPHVATIARCDCGFIDCGSIEVIISLDAGVVTWQSIDSTNVVRFEADSYTREVSRAQSDFSWETPDRTTARLVEEAVDRQALAARGFSFEWASGRLKLDAMSVSLIYESGPYQLIVNIPTRNAAPSELALRCISTLAEDASTWNDVVWYPQRQGLGVPAIAAAGWKKG